MRKILIITLLSCIYFIYSEDINNNLSWSKSINWDKNNIEIKIKAPLISSGKTLAATRIKAQNLINDNKLNIFFKNILDIQISSLENVSQIINNEPETYYRLDKLGSNMEPVQKNMTTNLEFLETVYRFPLYPDFLSLFYNQSQHVKKLKKIDHINYGEFTGLIIYVPESLPLYQKNQDGTLKKVIFPRIFDEDMNLIYDYTMVEPDYMKKWGMVIYGNSFNENIYQQRIGISPLRIIARGLFGKTNSDIIISKEEADKLIGTIENLKIISQARILILN